MLEPLVKHVPEVADNPLADPADHQTVEQRQRGLNAEDAEEQNRKERQGAPLVPGHHAVDQLLDQKRDRQIEKTGQRGQYQAPESSAPDRGQASLRCGAVFSRSVVSRSPINARLSQDRRSGRFRQQTFPETAPSA